MHIIKTLKGRELLPVDSFSKCLQQLELGQAKARNWQLNLGSFLRVTGTQQL